jgi:hypothetical protein
MSTTYIPTQHRINDPYQQRILQFNDQDSRVYLSRISNYLLKSFGDDAIIKGFDILSSTFDGNVFEVVVDSGILIQDHTLIEVTEPSTLSINVSGFNDCTGFLLIYTDYQYIESIGLNQFSLKIAYVTANGLVFRTDSSTFNWIPIRNRIFITSFKFTKNTPNTATETTFPDYLYLNGSRYEKHGGLLNFYRSTDPCPSDDPFFFNLIHEYNETNSSKLIAQLMDSNGSIFPITSLQLLLTNISVSIDEYKPFTEPYKLFVNKPEDAIEFTILSSQIEASDNIYELEHNLGQQYFLVNVYDDQGNLFHPHYINFTDTNTLSISFLNNALDLTSSYTIVLVTDPILTYPLTITSSTPELVDILHSFKRKNVMLQLVDPFNNLYDNMHINNSVFNISTNDEFTVNTDVCDFIDGTYTIIVYRNTRNVYFLNSNNTYVREHHLVTRRVSDEFLDESSDRSIEHNFDDLFPATSSINQDEYVNVCGVTVTNGDIVKFNFPPLSLIEGDLGGRAFVYSYDCNSVYSLTSLTSGASGTTNTYSLETSDWDDVPIFQIYNSSDKLINLEDIRRVGSSNVYEFDFVNTLDPTDINIVVLEGWDSYTETFEPDLAPVLITHNLNSKYLLTQIFDTDTLKVVNPTNIEIIDKNSVNIYLPGTATSYKINIVTGLISTLYGISYNNGYYYLFSDEQIVDNIVTVTHNLDFMYPTVQVYDSENYQISDVIIEAVDQNTTNLIFPVDLELYPNYKAIFSILKTTTTL